MYTDSENDDSNNKSFFSKALLVNQSSVSKASNKNIIFVIKVITASQDGYEEIVILPSTNCSSNQITRSLVPEKGAALVCKNNYSIFTVNNEGESLEPL